MTVTAPTPLDARPACAGPEHLALVDAAFDQQGDGGLAASTGPSHECRPRGGATPHAPLGHGMALVLIRFVFYNIQEGRPLRRVMLELRILARVLRPKVLCGVEGVGYDLKPIRGYVLIRDRSTPERANVFVYVRANRRIGRVRWHDLHQTWRMVKHPGMHDPRSFLELVVEHVLVLVGHQAQHPATTPHHDTGEAQSEGADLVEQVLTPQLRPSWEQKSAEQRLVAEERPMVAILDWNDSREGGPTAQTVAEAVGGVVAGRPVDRAVVRNAKVKSARYVGGVLLGQVFTRLLSDHREAFVLDLLVARRWWPTR